MPEKIPPSAGLTTPAEDEPVSPEREYFTGTADDATGIKNVSLLLVRKGEQSTTTILQFVNATFDPVKKQWSYPIPYFIQQPDVQVIEKSRVLKINVQCVSFINIILQ